MGLEVSWLPKQEVVWLLSQQNSERKTGISIQNTNQLAGNRAFIILLTLISFQRKCPESPLSGSLPLCSSALWTVPPLCLTRTNSKLWQQHIQHFISLYSCQNQAQGEINHGSKMWRVLSGQTFKCGCSVERLFIDRINKLQDAVRDWEIVTKTRRAKTAGWGWGECKYTISLQISCSESQEVVK